MATNDFFKAPPSLNGFDWTNPPVLPSLQGFKADFGNVIDEVPGLSPASAPSPAKPGAESGWGKQWADLLSGVGKLGAGLGAGIAAARGDMPMAGQLLSSYFQDKTGDKDESEESSLTKALRALKDSGIISFKLDTGDQEKLNI
jgi:hypothetical protein